MKYHGKQSTPDVDIALAVLCARFRGIPLRLQEIANATGLTIGGVEYIEKKALRKLRQKIRSYLQ